ncbi:MAG: hypothetical protein IPJ65_37230 [Archangiaceae bacterium]|nr:hypothetical protein [Archangiaceae bacterium]
MNARRVTLPVHLWSALDDMSRDAAQSADALMELAVEQFVALQGFELPVAPRAPQVDEPSEPQTAAEAEGFMPGEPAPAAARKRGLQDVDEDEGPMELARTAHRVAIEPSPSAPPPPEARAPSITGLGPTHLARRKVTPAEVEKAPKVTDPEMAIPPPASAPAPVAPAPTTSTTGSLRARAVPQPPAPVPEWVTRPALSDADEERAAARERMVAIERDLERLTHEKPSTGPLGPVTPPEEPEHG